MFGPQKKDKLHKPSLKNSSFGVNYTTSDSESDNAITSNGLIANNNIISTSTSTVEESKTELNPDGQAVTQAIIKTNTLSTFKDPISSKTFDVPILSSSFVSSTRSNPIQQPLSNRPNVSESGEPIVQPYIETEKSRVLENALNQTKHGNGVIDKKSHHRKLSSAEIIYNTLLDKTKKRWFVTFASLILSMGAVVLAILVGYMILSRLMPGEPAYSKILTTIKTNSLDVDMLHHIEKFSNQEFSVFVDQFYKNSRYNKYLLNQDIQEFLEENVNNRWLNNKLLSKKDVDTLKKELSINSRDEINRYYDRQYEYIHDAHIIILLYSTPKKLFQD